jgi:hypothetical protein
MQNLEDNFMSIEEMAIAIEHSDSYEQIYKSWPDIDNQALTDLCNELEIDRTEASQAVSYLIAH